MRTIASRRTGPPVRLFFIKKSDCAHSLIHSSFCYNSHMQLLVRKLLRIIARGRPARLRIRKRRIGAIRSGSRVEYAKHKELARKFTHEKLEEFNHHYGFFWGRVAIRNQRSRWGSCSKKGNLNFNYRIINLPTPLAEYIIVHELCHLRELNHSKRFWALVSQTIPDHAKRRRALVLYAREMHARGTAKLGLGREENGVMMKS